MTEKSWSETQFSNSLEALGIRSGDTIFVHSNLGLFGLHDPTGILVDTVLNSLQFSIGNSGTLILPAFTYSLSQNLIFNPKSNTGLTSMGALSQRAFQLSFPRTLDPMFSVFVLGKDSEEILASKANFSNGPGSIFHELLQRNTKVISMNMGAGSTLIHEMEYQLGVKYRFMKEFNGYTYNSISEQEEPIKWSAFVRRLDIENSTASFRQLTKEFTKLPDWKTIRLGRGSIGSYESVSMKSYLQNKLNSSPFYLTERHLMELGER